MTPDQTNILFGIFFFSLINIAIGLFSRRKNKITVEVYIANPDTTTFAMLTTSLMGTIIGGGMFFTVAQLGYEAGFAGMFLGISYLFGFFLLGNMSSQIRDKMKKESVFTIFDYFEKRLGATHTAKKIVRLFRICTAVLYMLFLAAQIIIISTFVQNIYPNFSSYALMIGCVLIFAVNSVSYTFLGGLQKDILTDGWQMFLVVIGIILITVFIGHQISIVSSLPKTYFYGTNKGVVLLIGIILFTGPSLLVRPDMWQRIVSAKNNKTAKYAFFSAGIFSFIGFTFFTLIGMYSKAANWISGDIFLFQLTSNAEGIIPTLILISLFGAVMSSADTFLNVCSFTVTSLVSSKKNDAMSFSVKNLRASTLVVAVIALIIAFSLPNLIDLFATGFGLLFLFFPTLYWVVRGGSTAVPALYNSLIIGLLVYFPLVFFMPKEAFLPAFIISLVSYFLLTKKTEKNTQPGA